MAAISPSLTASSSTTAYNSNPYDLEADFNMDKVQDFADIFNLLESESSQSHSPNTISPNHTPSPLPGIATPVAISPTQDFLNFDFDANQYTTMPKAPEIKQEPVEFGFSIPQGSTTPPVQAPAQPEPTNFLGLPADQQYALQQLLDNMVRYQQQYGLEQANANASTSGTVQPSMVFNSPVPPQPSLPSSQASAAPSASVSPQVLKQSPPQSDDELIAIDALEPPVRKERQLSSSSMPEDLDAKIESLVPLPQIFSAGRGKGGKKGGGLSSVVRGEDEDIDEDDSWRPSPEEYKKLSSKEKRQLRNKLSARAFRTRRKDYIGTLEAHIKDRDSVIDAIRSELVSSRVENQDLRRELEALKKSTMSILHPETATSTSTPPNLMANFTMPVSLPQGIPEAGPSKPRTVTPKFNTRKDLPSTSLDTTKAFWGGSNDFLGGGGSTICHTMFTPDLVLPQTQTQTSPLKSMHDLPRVNINPRLNEEPRRASPPPPKDDLQGTFQEWSENNAFNLRSMDSYRMQIWSRLAREAAAEKTSMPVDIRPKFYTESSTSAAASLAATATNHVTSKLASSFWSAFTRTGSRNLDTDKLAAVVTGQSRLQVVPSKEHDLADDLAASLSGLRLHSGLSSAEGTGLRARENPLGAITNFVFKLSPSMTRA